MAQHFYTTVENQLRDNGTFGLLYDHFAEGDGLAPALNRAQAKYHTICAAAALSEIPYHAAYILRDDGAVIEEAVWDRRESV